MAFFTALFTVLGEHIATVITGALVLGAAYVGLSPRGRLVIKGLRNYLTSNATNNPKIAAGVFDEKIRELREMKKKAVELAEKANGSLVEMISKEESARNEYSKLSSKAKKLELQGTDESHQQALLLARQAKQAYIKAEDCKAEIPNLQVTVTAVSDRLNEIDWKISDMEARKEKALSDMKKGKLEKEISEELQELNISEIDASIKDIEEHSNETKFIGVGARMAYENSDKKRVKDAIESADYDDAESFLKGLMENND